MIAPIQPEPNGLPESLGDYGGGISAKRSDQQTLRLIERAVKGGWGIRRNRRRAIAAKMEDEALDESNEVRDRIRAGSVVRAMVADDRAVAMKLLDKIAPDQHEMTHHVAELRQALGAARQDREYVELERRRAIADGIQSGTNGHNGHAGQMDDGPAPRFG